MPRHVFVMVAVIIAFFGLIWLGMEILNQPAGTTLVLSFLTLMLVGFGLLYSTATLRRDKADGDD